MVKDMAENEQFLIGKFFDKLPEVAKRIAARRNIPIEEAQKTVIEKILALRQPIDTTKETQASKKFVVESKQKAQLVSESRRAWARENKYTIPPNITSQEHLTNITRFLKDIGAATNPDLAWLGTINPDLMQSYQAAEYIARMALMPKDLLDDPNILYREAARLACSKDTSLTADAQKEINGLLNKTILRIRELRKTKAFNLNDEEVIYTLRGLVLYDEELDGPITDLHFKAALEDQLRQLEALNDLPADQEIRELEQVRRRLISGRVEEISKGKREFYKYDPREAAKYAQRITRHIEACQRQINTERTLVGWEPDTAEEAVGGIGQVLRQRLETAEELEVFRHIYETLPEDQKELFRLEIERRIRALISDLEEEPQEYWHRGSIQRSQERELGSWLNLLSKVDRYSWQKISEEEEARSFLHTLIKTMESGASPLDTKRLLEAQQRFDKMELNERIAQLPGISRVYQLFDQNYEEYFQTETDPVNREKFRQKIISLLVSNEELKGRMAASGIKPEAAYRVGYRHWKEVGREGWMYRTYIRKNKLITIEEVTGPDGKKYPKAIINDKAPILWDPLRLIYCPEAMWVFFGFGSYRGGDPVSFINAKGQVVETIGARGVGADVIKKMLDSGLDFLVQDYYSRRKGYVLLAWIAERLDEPGFESERTAWYSAPEQLKKEKGADWEIFYKVYGLRKKTTRLRMNVEFAETFGTQVWELTKDPREAIEQMQKEIKKIRDKASAHPKLKQILDDLETEYSSNAKRADEINTALQQERYDNNIASQAEVKGQRVKWFEDPTFSDAFLSMGGYDISKIPFRRMMRLQENVRGNFRDHFTALTIYTAFGDFINNPIQENLMKIPVSQAKGYTMLSWIQARMVVPAYNALVDVQRGKGPLGFDLGISSLRSKYGLVRDVKSMDDLDIYKLTRWLVSNEYLDKNMAYKLRGNYLGWLRDKGLEYGDPMMVAIMFMGMVQKQIEEIAKDEQKR